MSKNIITLHRLSKDAKVNEAIPPGWIPETVEAEFVTADGALKALERIKEVIKIVVSINVSRKDWPDTKEWETILPHWLLGTFRPEYTAEEKEELIKNKQPRKEWALEDWRYYFKNRVWEWWSGKTEDNKLVLEILVDGHPYSIYELKCLLELAGAKSVKVID